MSEFKTIDEGVFVSSQVEEADLDLAKSRCVTLIINNRPDGEEKGQPTSDQVKVWAEARAIDYKHIPVTGSNIPLQSISEFGILLSEAEGNVLAYCRSGMRSCSLWALAHAAVNDLTNEEILSVAKGAGYDLDTMLIGLESVRKAVRLGLDK
jgi:uncharacterized protein (TIGR01244 family)